MFDALGSPPASRATPGALPRPSGPTAPRPTADRLRLEVNSYARLVSLFPDQLTLGGRARLPTERDIAFASVSPQAIADALVGRNPLGTTVENWGECLHQLGEASRRDGIADAQLGITGSSVKFLSEARVRFPSTGSEVWEQAKQYGGMPERAVEAWSRTVYAEVPADALPTHHFWNTKRLLKIWPRESDIDLNLYGPEVDRKIALFARRANLTLDELIREEGGGVYRVKYMRLALPEIALVLKRWSKVIGRPVDLTAKPYVGPEGRPECMHDLSERWHRA